MDTDEPYAAPRSCDVKYLDEFRDPVLAGSCSRRDPAITTRPWTIMEVCGGQTHTIVRFGLDQLLPAGDRADPRPRLPGLRHAARA